MAESITAAAKLKGVLREFRDVATATASQIVEEMFLPLGERTIRPVDVGGVAGGTKFIHNGCFFKFVETSAIYASYAQVGQAPLPLLTCSALFLPATRLLCVSACMAGMPGHESCQPRVPQQQRVAGAGHSVVGVCLPASHRRAWLPVLRHTCTPHFCCHVGVWK